MKSRHFLILLILLACLSLILNLLWGPSSLPWSALWGHNLSTKIIWQLRWPLASTAFVTGGLLALSGALLQILLRNPLADPYILGISGGAATARLLGISILGTVHLSLCTFMGALIATLILYSFLDRNHFNTQRLLLLGITLASAWGAIISLLLALSPNEDLGGLLFWLMGDIQAYETPWISMLILSLAGIYSYTIAPQLNLLTQGPLKAQSLGVNVPALQRQLYFITALLTATAVNLSGTIGFVGLITPHLLRLAHRSDHRFVLPASLLLGGTLVSFANILKQCAPVNLPVGVLLACIGLPIFLMLLLKRP